MSEQKRTHEVPIIHRDVVFQFQDDDFQYWNDGSPAKTHFWNALSLGLPQLENSVVKIMSQVRESISDERLREDVRVFCMQESRHAVSHNQFNVGAAEQRPFMKKGSTVEGSLLRFINRISSKRFMVGMFAGFEHVTAIISHYGLDDPDRWFSNCTPEVFRLWEWHAVEELEHKSVCFDVYRHLGGSHLMRCLSMFVVTFLVLFPSVALRLIYFLWKDGRLFERRTFKDIYGLIVAKEGVLRVVAAEYFNYFRFRFHPWDQDSSYLIDRWKQGEQEAALA